MVRVGDWLYQELAALYAMQGAPAASPVHAWAKEVLRRGGMSPNDNLRTEIRVREILLGHLAAVEAGKNAAPVVEPPRGFI